MITTKDRVLYALRMADGFVSGEGMCERIGVSRAAVNAAVKSLRAEGYEIESVTRRGYRLVGGERRLCVGELMCEPFVSFECASKITVLDCVCSTNTLLRDLCAEHKAAPGDCVVTDVQTAGRGRRGKSFESHAGKGLYLSYAMDARDASPALACRMTAWGAAAVREAIAEVCGAECGIKWVNDLVYGTRKLCGILTEMSVEAESGSVQNVVMGVGINVNQTATDFSDEIRDAAISLFQITGRTIDRVRLCAAILAKLDAMQRDFPANPARYLAAYRAHNAALGHRVCVRGRQGTAIGIGDDFSLIVRYEDGTRESVFGADVSIEGFYGT